MWVIVHTVTGMAIGAALLDRGWGTVVVSALLLHILLDVVPHWDYTSHPRSPYFGTADVVVSAAILIVAATHFGMEAKVIVAGMISAAPDLDVLNSLSGREQRWRLFPSHWSRFPHGSCNVLPGIAIQGAFLLLAIVVLVTA